MIRQSQEEREGGIARLFLRVVEASHTSGVATVGNIGWLDKRSATSGELGASLTIFLGWLALLVYTVRSASDEALTARKAILPSHAETS